MNGENQRKKILEKVRHLVTTTMKEFPCKIYLFGSFARGEEQLSSDIDIAIERPAAVPTKLFLDVKQQLEESTIPYRVDVVDLYDASETLKTEIHKVGIEWIVSH